MRVLVCGDRNWAQQAVLYAALDALHARHPITCVIEGEARGADSMARNWAISHGIAHEPYPAKWHVYGRAAGPIRNQQMLDDGKPEQVIAFHEHIEQSRGTRDMLQRAEGRGIPTKLVSQ